VELDPGAIEKDLFHIDHAATAKAVRAAISRRDELVARELPFLKEHKIQLILADIPFLAGDIAEVAAIPIIGITNFTWDWIYEPYFASHGDLLKQIQNSYKKIPTLLKIPFGGRTDWFKGVIDIPIIASTPRRCGEEVLNLLHLDSSRPRVLISLRGGISEQTLISAGNSCRDYTFLATDPLPPHSPGNVLHFPLTRSLTFSDLLATSSIALSKLGYGIVADCLAARKPLLWPRRYGFREDEVTHAEASRNLPMLEIPHVDLFSGNWKSHLDRLVQIPVRPQSLVTNGASVAARIISDAFTST
jgi:L-arabinokinase